MYKTSVPLTRAIQLYEAGKNVHQIGKILGYAGPTIWYALTRCTDIELRKPSRRKFKWPQIIKGSVAMHHDPVLNGWFLRGKDITEMMSLAIRGHLECPKPDAVLNIETHLFNTTLEADSCAFNLDVGKHLWLNKGRWSRLIKEYLPHEPMERLVSQCVEILSRKARLGATANMLFRDPDRYAKKHRWGGCLMGITFRGDNQKSGPATITFYSRTTYIGYMGLLDAAIASVLAGRIANTFNGSNPSAPPMSRRNIRFRWHISSQQLHCFKTLPYVFSQPDLLRSLDKLARNRKRLDVVPPTWKYLAKWYFKVLDGWDKWKHTQTQIRDDDGKPHDGFVQQWLSTEKYGPFKRIKRRWAESQRLMTKNIPPKLMVATLDFDKAV